MLSLYNKYFLPCCLDMACGAKPILQQREKVVPYATGEVLELGIGSGHNLPYYNSEKVSRIVGVDPDEHLWQRSKDRREACQIPVERVGISGESIPLEDASFDSVVVTYSLCTIPDPVKALQEAKRLLRPGGNIYFCEHGQAPDPKVVQWQKRIDPFWKLIAGGCHSGRNIPALFHAADLKLEKIEESYLSSGPKVLSYNYRGVATFDEK